MLSFLQDFKKTSHKENLILDQSQEAMLAVQLRIPQNKNLSTIFPS